jgi:hypothetical protein
MFAFIRSFHAAALVAALLNFLPAAAAEPTDVLPLKIVGTNVLNSQGEVMRLRGVNVASLEWTSDGNGRVPRSVEVAIHDWHANIVRLPLSQDRWFGHGPEQTDGGKAYHALVHRIVDYCRTNRAYIILDLHWSDCNEWGRNIGQHSMPDTNSVVFWRAFAPVFANDPAVLYDLYNEPHDVSWDVWLHGGTVTDKPNGAQAKDPPKTFEAVGMQTLLDTVRAAGARNVVVAGGLDWAYDFSGILQGRQLADPQGLGVIYANHCYDNKRESVATWVTNMEAASARLPIIVSEFGGQSGPSLEVPTDNWLLHVMRSLDEHRWSWVAWNLHTGAPPSLIADWGYTPTDNYGVYVKRALAGEPLSPQ